MFKLLLMSLITVANRHVNKLQSDADFETELMPQELNPNFVSNKDEPWRAIMPLKQRRDIEILDVTSTNTFKLYSRIITCVVLVISAIVEISVYLFESYIVSE